MGFHVFKRVCGCENLRDQDIVISEFDLKFMKEGTTCSFCGEQIMPGRHVETIRTGREDPDAIAEMDKLHGNKARRMGKMRRHIGDGFTM